MKKGCAFVVSKKYAEDYRLETVTDKKGLPAKKAVYVGPYYIHTASGAEVALSKKICLPACVAQWVLFAMCFVQNGTAARAWWVTVMFLAVLLPLVYTTWACITLSLSKAPFNRETSDDLSQRYPRVTGMLAGFAGAAFVAGCIACVLGKSFMLPGDPVYLGGLAAMCLLGLLLFSRRKSFETTEISRRSELFLRLMAEKESKQKG